MLKLIRQRLALWLDPTETSRQAEKARQYRDVAKMAAADLSTAAADFMFGSATEKGRELSALYTERRSRMVLDALDYIASK